LTSDDRSFGTLTGPGLSLRFSLAPWDTRALGYPVAQIDAIELSADGDPAPTLARFASWLDDHRVQLVSCRLDSLRLRESMLLEDVGFRFVGMVYSPVLSPLGSGGATDGEVVITAARGEDRAALERIASSVFTTGRHVLDWRLDRNAGHSRYRQWLDEALVDDRQDVLMATIGDETAGFFVVESRGEGGAYWHLTAVASEWQGQGVGKRIWRGMIARHRAAGVQRIETTISAHNTAVVNLYSGLGFRFTTPRATFHWLRR
jgi:ribosomal protein S18 acetylase RimI-like enzyme